MKKLLMIVDPQVDFITGSLPVPEAAEAMDALAEFIESHGDEYAQVVITSDAHPANHCSFVSNGGEWPAHCVVGTEGFKIWPGLAKALEANQPEYTLLLKGGDAHKEEYSIFANDDAREHIERIIKNDGIEHIDICGLAGDVCVAQSLADGQAIYGDRFFTLLPEFSPTIG